MNARPSVLRAQGHSDKYPIASQSRYTDEYVGDVQRGLKSCKVCESFTVFCYRYTYTIIDVPFLPILFHLLESDVEQSHLPSWNYGTPRDT